MFDIATVGHFSIDLITSPHISCPKDTLGGPPTYSSTAARKLGAEVSAISRVGHDFPSKYINWLTVNGIDLSGLKKVDSALTTRFILRYENGKRRLQLKSRAPAIEPVDVPEYLESKAVHAAPIANELSSETISKLRSLTEVLSFDPQGFIRRFDNEGNVNFRRIEDREILRNVDIFKSSTNELSLVADTANIRLAIKKVHGYGVETVIVTKGIEGSTLSHEGKTYSIPACQPKIVVDATGAGDVFIGAFLAEYVQGKDVTWCACVGSASASFVVEGAGPSGFGEKTEIYERASEAIEKLKSFKP